MNRCRLVVLRYVLCFIVAQLHDSCLIAATRPANDGQFTGAASLNEGQVDSVQAGPPYVRGSLGRNGCNVGQISRSASCEAAAKKLEYDFGETGSWPNEPKGCFYIGGSVDQVYYNTHTTGYGKSDSALRYPICQAADVPADEKLSCTNWGTIGSDIAQRLEDCLSKGATELVFPPASQYLLSRVITFNSTNGAMVTVTGHNTVLKCSTPGASGIIVGRGSSLTINGLKILNCCHKSFAEYKTSVAMRRNTLMVLDHGAAIEGTSCASDMFPHGITSRGINVTLVMNNSARVSCAGLIYGAITFKGANTSVVMDRRSTISDCQHAGYFNAGLYASFSMNQDSSIENINGIALGFASNYASVSMTAGSFMYKATEHFVWLGSQARFSSLSFRDGHLTNTEGTALWAYDVARFQMENFTVHNSDVGLDFSQAIEYAASPTAFRKVKFSWMSSDAVRFTGASLSTIDVNISDTGCGFSVDAETWSGNDLHISHARIGMLVRGTTEVQIEKADITDNLEGIRCVGDGPYGVIAGYVYFNEKRDVGCSERLEVNRNFILGMHHRIFSSYLVRLLLYCIASSIAIPMLQATHDKISKLRGFTMILWVLCVLCWITVGVAVLLLLLSLFTRPEDGARALVWDSYVFTMMALLIAFMGHRGASMAKRNDFVLKDAGT